MTKLEIYEPGRFVCTADGVKKCVMVGFIHETDVVNFSYWKMLSFTIHWPWIRHFSGFVVDDEGAI